MDMEICIILIASNKMKGQKFIYEEVSNYRNSNHLDSHAYRGNILHFLRLNTTTPSFLLSKKRTDLQFDDSVMELGILEGELTVISVNEELNGLYKVSEQFSTKLFKLLD